MAVTISTTRGVNLDIREIVSFPEFVEIGVPFTCELKLYNRSGGSVWGYDLYACPSNSSGTTSTSVRIATTNLSKNHSSGSTATVKFSCVIEDPDNKLGTGHVLTGIKFWLWGMGNSSFVEPASSGSSYLQGGEVLSTRWNPTITAFSGQRYDQASGTVSDESPVVSMQIQGTAASAMTVTVRFFENGVEATNLRRTATSASFNFSGNYTLSAGSNWEIKITYGDKYETAENSLTIARAFANVHLSGATYRENGVNRQIGGVAFGKFSSVKSTPDASGKNTGKFECVYPATFEGGIMNIQSGMSEQFSFSSAYKDFDITFSPEFKTLPVVITGFQSASTSSAFGRCTCGVVRGTLTTTGCTIRIYNGASATIIPEVFWLAYGLV